MPKRFDALIKFRCYKALMERVKAIAERRFPGDKQAYAIICREAMKAYCEAEEKKLGIKPPKKAKAKPAKTSPRTSRILDREEGNRSEAKPAVL